MDCIKNEFSPLSLFQLRQVNKDLSKISDNDIWRAAVKSIDNKLEEIFQDDMGEFKTLLAESKAVISGSFIVQCILGEFYEDSDIDIYVPVKNVNLQLKRNDPITELEKFLLDINFGLIKDHS